MTLRIKVEGKVALLSDFDSFATDIWTAILKTEELPTNCEVSLLFCDNRFIKELNLSYRHLDTATDVLSFPQYEGKKEILDVQEETVLLGDVIISLEKAYEQSEKYGHTLERELSFLLVHGIMHLLGYSHDSPGARKEMRQKEEYYLCSDSLGEWSV